MNNKYFKHYQDEGIKTIQLMRNILSDLPSEERTQSFEEIKTKIMNLISIEENEFFNYLHCKYRSPDLESILGQIHQNHHVIKEFIQRLNLIDIQKIEWFIEMKSFKEFYTSHLKETTSKLSSSTHSRNNEKYQEQI